MSTPSTVKTAHVPSGAELRLKTAAALCVLLLALADSWAMDVLGISAARDVVDPYAFVYTVGVALSFVLFLSACLDSVRNWSRLAVAIELIAYIFLSSNVLMRFSYMTMAFSGAFPYWDNELLQADRALGYDWRAFARGVLAVPYLLEIFGLAYYSWVLQMLIVLVFTVAAHDFERFYGFVFLFLFTGAFCCLISMFVPAQALSYHFVSEEDFVLLGADSRFVAVLGALREGSFISFGNGGGFGIITFPSFHAASAVGLLWLCASRPVLRWWFMLPNVLTIVSALYVGGHYLVDVLAGAVVAVLGILAVRWISYSRFPLLLGLDRFFLAAQLSRERRQKSTPGTKQQGG